MEELIQRFDDKWKLPDAGWLDEFPSVARRPLLSFDRELRAADLTLAVKIPIEMAWKLTPTKSSAVDIDGASGGLAVLRTDATGRQRLTKLVERDTAITTSTALQEQRPDLATGFAFVCAFTVVGVLSAKVNAALASRVLHRSCSFEQACRKISDRLAPNAAGLKYVETIELPIWLNPDREVVKQFPSLESYLSREFAFEHVPVRVYRIANSSIRVFIPEKLGLTFERAGTLREALNVLPAVERRIVEAAYRAALPEMCQWEEARRGSEVIGQWIDANASRLSLHSVASRRGLASRLELDLLPQSSPLDLVPHLELLPNKHLIDHIWFPDKAHPADLWYAVHRPNLGRAISATGRIGGEKRLSFFPATFPEFDRPIRYETVAHEWAHLAQGERLSLISRAFESAATIEHNGFYFSEYARSGSGFSGNAHFSENWAVHFENGLLSKEHNYFVEVCKAMPLRTSVLAESLHDQLTRVPLTERTAIHQMYQARLKFVEMDVVPKVKKSLLNFAADENAEHRKFIWNFLNREKAG